MNRFAPYNIIICVVCSLLTLFSSCSNSSRPETLDLCILYTTDSHSMVFPYDFHHDQPQNRGLCNFYSLVTMQRALYGDRCLVLDNGNKLSGGPTAYYYKFADTISEPACYRIERMIGYDAIGIGSHDIEVPECLRPMRHDNSRQPPVICANLVNKQTGDPIYSPYMVFERQGVRIAVLGMIAPTSGDWIPYELWGQFDTQDMIECAKKWVPIIRQEAKPDILIGLFSCSKEYDNPSLDFDIDTYKNPEGGLPAAIRVPGFDLVLLGNTSESAVGHVIDDEGRQVTYLQSGQNCEKAGLARIHLQKQADGTYRSRVFTSLMDLSQFMPDPTLVHMFQNAQDSIRLWFNRPVGYLKDSIIGTAGIYGPDRYRKLINQAQLWYTQADISIASVIIPQDTVPAGPITMRQIFDLYPITQQLQTLTMTGEELRRFLEWGYGCQYETMTRPTDSLISVVKDPHGHVIYDEAGSPTLRHHPSNYISAAGIHYTVNVTKPIGERVEITSWADGLEFDPRNLFKVVISSEFLRDGNKFITRGLNWDRDELALHAVPTTHNSLRKILFDYFRAKDTVSISDDQEWSIVPEQYWRTAQQNVLKDLNPIW